MTCYDRDDDICSESIYNMYLLQRVHLRPDTSCFQCLLPLVCSLQGKITQFLMCTHYNDEIMNDIMYKLAV